MRFYTERQAAGRFAAMASMDSGQWPRRIGFIIGGRATWLAERGAESLGYFKTRNAALAAIAALEPFICEACSYPSHAPHHCDNPACLENPTIPESHKVKMRAAHAAHLAELAAADERRAFKARLSADGFTAAF